MESRFLTTLTS